MICLQNLPIVGGQAVVNNQGSLRSLFTPACHMPTVYLFLDELIEC